MCLKASQIWWQALIYEFKKSNELLGRAENPLNHIQKKGDPYLDPFDNKTQKILECKGINDSSHAWVLWHDCQLSSHERILLLTCLKRHTKRSKSSSETMKSDAS